MTTLKSLMMVSALLLGGTSLGMAQNGPPDRRPTAGSWWRGCQSRSIYFSLVRSSSSRHTASQNVHVGKPHPQRFKIDAG